MPDGEMNWQSYKPGEEPDWLRSSRGRRVVVGLRVTLHRALGIPAPFYVAYQGSPIGPRRIFRRIKRLS
jgi:hypothetical protein